MRLHGCTPPKKTILDTPLRRLLMRFKYSFSFYLKKSKKGFPPIYFAKYYLNLNSIFFFHFFFVKIHIQWYLKQLERRNLEKKIWVLTGLEHMTSVIPVRCSTNLTMKLHIGSEVNSYLPVRDEMIRRIYEKIHMWTAYVIQTLWKPRIKRE